MARKDDMDLSIKIEPSNFNVELVSDNGQLIDKKRLSAGEKQIYALAILEALGKASGRKLPFIIDTPLGRLDSKHRQKIVKEFFPKVNDQVIILSTDTEVDEAFFRDLEPHISKSYELKYDSSSGSSSVLSGYFWRG
jgi:DNA sulfur modification protein DndD